VSTFQPWDVRQVDLSVPNGGLTAAPDTGGIHVQLHWKSIPLGQLWLALNELPLTASDFLRRAARAIAPAVGDRLFEHGFRAALPVVGENPARDKPAELGPLLECCQPLAVIERALGQIPVPKTSVSVIVCTRGRPDPLRNCLAALARLDPAADEILVVDNSAEGSARRITDQFPGVMYVSEPQPGLSRARNAGLRQATGTLIAWTDDDVVPHPFWLGAIRRTFADETISAMTGLVLPLALNTAAQVRFERNFGGFNRGYRRLTYDRQFFSEMAGRGVPVWDIGAGANMAFRSSVFAQIGTFDERLGAGAAGCSEDSELWYRMLAKGLTIRYEPLAAVWHGHRAEDDAYGAQMEEYMRGHVAALLVQFEKHRHSGNLRRLLLALPRHYLRRMTLRGGDVDRSTLGREMRGCLRGVCHYLRNRPLRRTSPASAFSP